MPPTWSTACPDWADRLKAGRSIIPPPIYPAEAERALEIFKSLRVVDLPATVWDEEREAYRSPTFGECCDQWVFDFVAAIFGAYDSETGQQLIREFFLLISKKNTKSTLAAGVMLTATILCWRHGEEHLILAPTKEVADNSYKPAAAMVLADDELRGLFHVQDHVRTITHRVEKQSLKVVAADTETVSGKKSGRILIDEHWIFGKRAGADGMLMEATGGLVSRDEGFVIILSTQSDEPPAGVFAEKLRYYRDVRDGKVHDPKSLGVLYEMPPDVIEAKAYLERENFRLTNPNLGRSVSAEWIEDQITKLRHNTDGSFQKFLAKHLNVEIGLNLRSDRWAGAEFWQDQAAEDGLTLDDLLARCDLIAVGLDGGGLDDLFGFNATGRDRATGDWLSWSRAWVHPIALERRKENAERYRDFAADGDLVIVEQIGDDVQQIADLVEQVYTSGLLHMVGVDPAGIGAVLDELEAREIPADKVVGVSQGWKLTGAIKTAERRLADGTLHHDGSRLMAWCIGNAKVEPRGNAITITKQAAGAGKIDPLMAQLNSVSLLMTAPALVVPQIINLELA